MADRYLSTPLAPQPETQKLKAERDAKLLEQKQAELAKRREENRAKRLALGQRTVGYNQEYAAMKKAIVDGKKAARAAGGFYVPEEAKVILVVRIKGVNKIAPKPRKVLLLLRLLQIHNAALVKVNKATKEMLKLIEPFVTYGYPTVETLRKLIYKRGHVRVGPMGSRQRIRIQNNHIIDEHLGQYGIHGVEDMVHELYTVGPHFKEVNNFLHVFKLKPPRKGFVCKRHGFAEYRKGDWGNRETLINELVCRML